MKPEEIAKIKELIEKETYQKRMEVEKYAQNYNADPEILDRIKELERNRNREREDTMIHQALQQAITETVQRIASVIINERHAEIEAACNFGELRDVLAAELARQFMASRLTGAPTPFDAKPSPGYGGTAVGVTASGQLLRNVAVKVTP